MRIIVHYLQGIEASEALAARALESILKHSWECEMRAGYTVRNAPKMPIMPVSQLSMYSAHKQLTKMACLANHVRLWREVVAANEPMVFAEHDARCIAPPPTIGDLDAEVTQLADKASRDIRVRGLALARYNRRVNPYRDAAIMLGTAAYAVTPEGAKKLLAAFNTNGAEQSDWMINDRVVTIGYKDLFTIEKHGLNSSGGGVIQ